MPTTEQKLGHLFLRFHVAAQSPLCLVYEWFLSMCKAISGSCRNCLYIAVSFQQRVRGVSSHVKSHEARRVVSTYMVGET